MVAIILLHTNFVKEIEGFINNEMKELALNGNTYEFPTGYAAIDTKDILNIYVYLIERYELQWYLGLLILYLLQYWVLQENA